MKRKLTIAKFGGSALGVWGENIPVVVETVRRLQARSESLVLIFSAPLTVYGGQRQSLTDVALSIGRSYADGRPKPLEPLFEPYDRIAARFVKEPYLERCLAEKSRCMEAVSQALRQAMENRLFVDVNRARALAYSGELLASAVMDYVLRGEGFDSEHLTMRDWPIITDKNFESAALLLEESRRSRDALVDLLDLGKVVCMGGFIGKTVDGLETTFERGGSDRTAADLAIILSDQYLVSVTFEKDTPVLSVNPKIPSIRGQEVEQVDALSYNEAILAGQYGMRIIDPIAIRDIQAAGLDIPLIVNDLGGRGQTLIQREPRPARAGPVKIVTGRKGCVIVETAKAGRSSLEDYVRMVLKHQEVVELSPYDGRARFLFLDGGFVWRHVEEFRAFDRDTKFEGGLGAVTIIGDEMWRVPGIAAAATSALMEGNVNILDCDIQRPTSRILIIVREEEVDRCVALIHSRRKEMNRRVYRADLDAGGRGVTASSERP